MQSDRDSPFRSPIATAMSGGLARLAERAQWLEALDLKLRQSLPPPLDQHCRLANVRDDRLVFLVATPGWKARLRLHADTVLAAAAEVGLTVQGLTVKVATMPPITPGDAPHTPLSPAARDALRSAAAATDDPQLRSRLLALASLAE